jgi:hypothetical protein
VRIDAIAQSSPALVKLDESGEGAEPLEQVAVARVLPMDLQIRDEARHEDKVYRSIADDLVPLHSDFDG